MLPIKPNETLRLVREVGFKQNQGEFAKNLSLLQAYVCKLERGEILMSEGSELHQKYVESIKMAPEEYRGAYKDAINSLTYKQQ